MSEKQTRAQRTNRLSLQFFSPAAIQIPHTVKVHVILSEVAEVSGISIQHSDPWIVPDCACK